MTNLTPDAHLDHLAHLIAHGRVITEADLWDGYAYEDLNFNNDEDAEDEFETPFLP